MNKGIVFIIVGIVLILSLFVIDYAASKQVFGPPYTYTQGEEKATEKESTYYPERAKGWVQGYYSIDKIIWGVGLPLSAILIGVGAWQRSKIKQSKKQS